MLHSVRPETVSVSHPMMSHTSSQTSHRQLAVQAGCIAFCFDSSH